MLDEFPALGRLDFFESQLAFMAGYGLKAFLIAQSLNWSRAAHRPAMEQPTDLVGDVTPARHDRIFAYAKSPRKHHVSSKAPKCWLLRY